MTTKANRASGRLAWPLAGAGLYAAAELGAGLLLGRFFDWGRAEALLFFAFRPWLLLAAAVLVSRRRLAERAVFYLSALLVAGVSESLLLLQVGADDPWPEMLRGVAAGALLVAAIDLFLQLGARLHRRFGRSAATVAILLFFLFAGALRPYERIALGPADRGTARDKPTLLLATGLPIIWGERGPFDPDSRPAAFYRLLQEEYDVRPLDFLDREALGRPDLMLLAQPRALAPEELVALDAWVRRGGRVLILADPQLAWPTELPLGDFRRPPPSSLLHPLLRHWGLRLDARTDPGLVVRDLTSGGRERRLVLAAPGRFTATGPACRAGAGGLVARCRLGEGVALLLADADLIRDEVWLLPGGPPERHFRTADNPLVLFDWLDGLAGVERRRIAAPVDWADPPASRPRAVALALLPPLLLSGLGLGFALRRRRG